MASMAAMLTDRPALNPGRRTRPRPTRPLRADPRGPLRADPRGPLRADPLHTRRRPAPALAALAALIALTLMPLAPASAEERDNWYEDLGGHWAAGYVHVLWDERVVDGWPSLSSNPVWRNRTYFRPNNDANRVQFTMMLAKVFRLQPLWPPVPSFPDVPYYLTEYHGKPAYPYVEAANRAGFIAPPAGGLFRPSAALQRQAAFALLVGSLGLGPWADSMDRDYAARALARFRDARDVAPESLKPVAASVVLGIVEGYPDGTLRPGRTLSRAEAATVVYRSCLTVVDARPNPFSPDGDGVEDSTTLSTLTLKNRNLSGWKIEITDYQGNLLALFGPGKRGDGGGVPPVEWRGRDLDGRVLPPATYFYRGTVWDRTGREFTSVRKPLTIEEKRLTGALHPREARPGSAITVDAHTTGGALSATASIDGGPPLAMKPTSPAGAYVNDWSLSFTVPPGHPEGEFPVAVDAAFRGTGRDLLLSYLVNEPFSIDASIAPNPAPAGAAVELSARTSRPADRVTAALPWAPRRGRNPWGGAPPERNPHGRGSPPRYAPPDRSPGPGRGASTVVDLAPGPGGVGWSTSYELPDDIAPGSYEVTFAGRSGAKTARTIVRLLVLRDPLLDLRFILTD